MAKYQKIVSVFLASPGDVQEERNMADSVVQELNKTWSKSLNLKLDLIKWETDIYPGKSDYSQDVINQQINSDYDIFIAIFWGRIGSETKKAVSGTVEELESALAKYNNSKDSVDIMIYFKDQAISPSQIDTDQLQKINILKKTLEREGILYWGFEGSDQFSSLLRTHLSKVAQKWAERPRENGLIQNSKDAHKDQQTENDDDYGLFDYIEIYEDKMFYMSTALKSMADATEKIGSEINTRTDEILEYQGNSSEQMDVKSIKKLINKTSENMNDYCDVMEVQVKVTQESRDAAFQALSKAISFYVDVEEKSKVDNFEDIKSELTTLIQSVSSTNESLVSFRESIAAFPRLTGDLNKSKRRTVKILDNFLEGSKIVVSTAKDIIRTIEEIEN